MAEQALSEATVVHFHLLERRQEGEEWLVGRQETSTYVTLPGVGVEVIDLLQGGMTVGAVKAEIAAHYGEAPQMEPFIQAMLDCGFVETLGDRKVAVTQKERHMFWPSLRPEQVAWLFSPPALILYTLAFLWIVWVWSTRSDLLPRASDYFYHPSVTITVISLWVIGWVEIAFHEFWHFLAARSRGVKADFSLSTRLTFIVAQTDVSGVWSIPREKRYIIYLAGMMFDALWIATLLGLLVLNDSGYISLPVLVYKLFKALIFGQFWGIIWQFQFFMRTDVYYVAANWLNCKNLAGDSRMLVRFWLWKFFGRWPLPRTWKASWSSADLNLIPLHEMRSVRIYLPFYLLGSAVVLGRFFFNTLPIAWGLIVRSVLVLAQGWTNNQAAFIDALIYTLFSASTWGLLAFLILRNRRRRGRAGSNPLMQTEVV